MSLILQVTAGDSQTRNLYSVKLHIGHYISRSTTSNHWLRAPNRQELACGRCDINRMPSTRTPQSISKKEAGIAVGSVLSHLFSHPDSPSSTRTPDHLHKLHFYTVDSSHEISITMPKQHLYFYALVSPTFPIPRKTVTNCPTNSFQIFLCLALTGIAV